MLKNAVEGHLRSLAEDREIGLLAPSGMEELKDFGGLLVTIRSISQLPKCKSIVKSFNYTKLIYNFCIP